MKSAISLENRVKRNEVKTSSLSRHNLNKPQRNKIILIRPKIQSNRSSREFANYKNKHDLILIGVNRQTLSDQRQSLQSSTKNSVLPPSFAKEDNKLFFQPSRKLNLNFASRNENFGGASVKSKTKTDFKFSKILSEMGLNKQSTNK